MIFGNISILSIIPSSASIASKLHSQKQKNVKSEMTPQYNTVIMELKLHFSLIISSLGKVCYIHRKRNGDQMLIAFSGCVSMLSIHLDRHDDTYKIQAVLFSQ